MDWFLSHYVHNVDSKGRVSVPGAFRQVIAARGVRDLFAMRSLTKPAMDVGGPDLLERYEKLMQAEDPLGDAFQDLMIFTYGDGAFLKFDSEGRITVTDFIRSHTGIEDKVLFMGAGKSFQLWEPGRFEAARDAARATLRGGPLAGARSAGTPE